MGQDLFAVVGAGGTVGGATVKTLLAQGRHVRRALAYASVTAAAPAAAARKRLHLLAQPALQPEASERLEPPTYSSSSPLTSQWNLAGGAELHSCQPVQGCGAQRGKG